jgi:hypothetical protein
MADPKLGDLVSCTKKMYCGERGSNSFSVARPLGAVKAPQPDGRIIDPGTVGVVVRDHLGSSELICVLVGDEVHAFWPQHLRVVQPYEECHAS